MTASTPEPMKPKPNQRSTAEALSKPSFGLDDAHATIFDREASLISHLPILLTTLTGLWLRLQNLTYHSLWFDEAISIRWANSSAAEIITVSMNLVEDRLPPLYYLLLKFWREITGISEFSVRYPSVVLGTLLIPVTYVLGKRLFGSTVGLVAALLVTFNPFLIWYSQEARMYALAVFEGTWGVLCFVIAVQAVLKPEPAPIARSSRRCWPWFGLGLAALAGLYTHFYTGFLWPALAIWLLLSPRLLKRVWLPFGLTMGGVLILFLPLLGALWRFSGESQPGDPLSNPLGRFLDLFQAFMIWQSPVADQTGPWLMAIFGLWLVVGIILALRQRSGQLMVLLLLLPFLIASLLLFRSELAFFGQRYFIVMVPWLLLLLALGSAGLGRMIFGRGRMMAVGRLMPSIILVALAAFPLPGQWTPFAAKEAWRQTVSYMTAHVHGADAVFIHPEWVRFPYQYYAADMQTPGKTYAAFFAVDQTTDLDGPLTGVVANHPVVWLIQSHIDMPDPDRRVEGWFAARYPLVTELYPPGIILKAYAPGYQLENVPPEAAPVDIRFAERLQLRGYEVIDRRLSPTEDLFHPPSNWIHVTLYWAAEAGVAEVVPYAQLVDDLGQVWGLSLDRPTDATRLYPPSRWGAGQIIRQDLDVNLNPAAPPGVYQLVVGVGEHKEAIVPIVLTANP